MILLLKNILFTVLIPGSVAVYAPLWMARSVEPVPGPSRVVAVALFALGSAIYAWTVWDFAVSGRATPAPIDAPLRLVAVGLYRYTRNPMYLGILTILAGHVVLFRSTALALYTAAVLGGFHAWVRIYEEPRLASSFGARYGAYRRRVRRWIPGPCAW